jgi:hypothetical protein
LKKSDWLGKQNLRNVDILMDVKSKVEQGQEPRGFIACIFTAVAPLIICIHSPLLPMPDYGPNEHTRRVVRIASVPRDGKLALFPAVNLSFY